MKIAFYNLGIQFEIFEGINSFVIESPEILEETILNLRSAYAEESGDIKLFDVNGKKLDFDKYCDLIYTPFDLTFEKKEIQRKLYSVLEDISLNEFGEKFAQFRVDMTELIDSIAQTSDYDIRTDECPDIKSYFKLYNVNLSEPEGGFDSKLIEYMITTSKLTGRRVFIIINCEAYLNSEAYAHLKKCARYYDLIIVFISGRQIKLLEEENSYIIDVDLCEIH